MGLWINAYLSNSNQGFLQAQGALQYPKPRLSKYVTCNYVYKNGSLISVWIGSFHEQ